MFRMNLETQKNLWKQIWQRASRKSLYKRCYKPNNFIYKELNEYQAFGGFRYASTVVDSAYEIGEQLNALHLASSQTEFLTQRR